MDSNGVPDTTALIERLKSHWSQSGIKVRPGVPPQQIEAFESRYQVSLPLDLREYFTTVDGMEDEDTFDSDMFSFLQLHAVRSLPDVLGEHGQISVHHEIMRSLPDPHRWFVIVDYLIGSALFAIRLSPIVESNPVLGYCGPYQIVASTFSDFLEAYLTDPLGLVSRW
jgi:hypothetical protein